MNPSLQAGLTHSRTVTVIDELTVPRISPVFTGLEDMPPVFATSYMVAFVEWTCLEAVKPFLEPGQKTVGAGIAIEHTAPSPVGAVVTAEVELLAVKGTALHFRFTCLDGEEVVAQGYHDRAIIDEQRFLRRLERRAAS